MNYYIDNEFLEGKQDKTFLGFKYGETKPTIDLISIGIVSENGREYYAISKDFNLKEAWNRFQMKETSPAKKYMGFYEEKEYWIRDNVLKPIFDEWNKYSYHSFTYGNMKYCINCIGKTNKQISEEIKHFVANRPIGAKKEQWILDYDTKDVKFYGYYADYDWVVFCWLFGRMIDLPEGFPMYCIDLKQLLDEKADIYVENNIKEPIVSSDWYGDYCVDELKRHPDYPKQENEHNALADAKWNKELHEFIKSL